jgi:predicted transcriptional regulator
LGNSPYSIRLDDDPRKALERAVAIEDRPPTQLVVGAIRAMLEAKVAKRAALEAALDEAERGVFLSADAMTAWRETWGGAEEGPPPKVDVGPDAA